MNFSGSARKPVGCEIAQKSAEHSLDPADWDEFARVAHRALDDAMALLRGIEAAPVWRQVPEAVKAELTAGIPHEPSGAETVCADISRLMLPYATGNIHPRFFGWVHGSGTAGGVIAEMLAAAMNANVGGRDHGAVYVERQVLSWCKELFGFPADASGLLVSGTSMATLIALNVARNAKAGQELRRTGLQGQASQLTAYASRQAHSSVGKALDILGIGSNAMRAIDVDGRLQMDPDRLRHAMRADRARGLEPFCVVATAGTVNTGAIDPLAEIADICAEERIWLHVDGAFGAMAMLSDELRPLLQGIERADSLAFDFHKWLHVPYDAGCVLIRDGRQHQATFSSRPDYLAGAERGLAGGDPWFCEFGPELSRGFRALKVWFTIREHGIERLGEQVLKNCVQAQYLMEKIKPNRWLELLAPVSLNIVCFRFHAPNLSEGELDEANAAIVLALQEQGIAAPSTTKVDGKLAIRVNITNHRTRFADLDLLVDSIVELGTDRLFSGKLPTRAALAELPQGTALSTAILEVGAEIDACRQFAQSDQRLTACLDRPEFRLLTTGIAFHLDASLSVPFVVENPARVAISPRCFESDLSGSVFVRHALELISLAQLWGEQNDQDEQGWLAGMALLACRTAGTYLTCLSEAERRSCEAAAPGWLSAGYDGLRQGGSWSTGNAGATAATELLRSLLGLQGVGPDLQAAIARNPVAIRAACEWLRKLGLLAVPVEKLFVSGGDPRIELALRSGRNSYGSSSRPVPDEISFSSSTATSVSQLQYNAVEALRQKLMAGAVAGEFQGTLSQAMNAVRAEILAVAGASNTTGADVVLTPSGTDAVLAALCFAMPGNETLLTSIVISPNENGSGVALAAAARHFSSRTAMGATVVQGEPIAGFATERIDVRTIPTRLSDGREREAWEIDSSVELIVEQAIGAGGKCLLHVLDASKLGWGAPTLELVDRLKARHGNNLEVVIDGCQMRLGRQAVETYLARGFLVQITGSKFFTGPPFCGALIVPGEIAGRLGQDRALPVGLEAYAGRDEWPAQCAGADCLLAAPHNLGLLARWTAALVEMRAYDGVPQEISQRILSRFAAETVRMIDACESLELVAAKPFDRSALQTAGSGDLWAGLSTIFPFLIHRQSEGGARRTVSLAEAKCIHKWLNLDLSPYLPVSASIAERRLAARPCLIGQPVTLGEKNGSTLAALRICASARMVTMIHAQNELAAGPDLDPMHKVLSDVRICIHKIELILVHFKELQSADAGGRL